jgi:hypothetical protein
MIVNEIAKLANPPSSGRAPGRSPACAGGVRLRCCPGDAVGSWYSCRSPCRSGVSRPVGPPAAGADTSPSSMARSRSPAGCSRPVWKPTRPVVPLADSGAHLQSLHGCTLRTPHQAAARQYQGAAQRRAAGLRGCRDRSADRATPLAVREHPRWSPCSRRGAEGPTPAGKPSGVTHGRTPPLISC